jgi:hypothetical protein
MTTACEEEHGKGRGGLAGPAHSQAPDKSSGRRIKQAHHHRNEAIGMVNDMRRFGSCSVSFAGSAFAHTLQHVAAS